MRTTKLFPPIKRQLASSLEYLFENTSASSKVINYSFKSNKKWGARDRRAFAEAFYHIVRNAGMYFFKIGRKDFTKLTEQEALQVIDLYEEGYIEKAPSIQFEYSISKDLESVLEKEMSLEERQVFLEASSKQASVFLRVNSLLASDEECINSLKEDGVESELVKPSCLKLSERKNIFTSKTFNKGFFEVQDGASQDVAHFLDLSKGMRVADSCAGAGGKTLHISALLENTGTVVAMDLFPRRLEELKKRAKRGKNQNIQIKELQGTKTVKRMEGKFDRVLLDVPCTGSGTYRRKPESKLFFSRQEHQRLLQTQSEIIRLHSKLVKSGGKMVYATCSVLPSENSNQVESFLKEFTDFSLEEEVLNKVGQDGFDGFYMARMIKK